MKKALPLYLITIAAFFMLIADSLLTTGMFMDGLIYSNVAANMAEGTCTFWQPTLSRGLFPEFYEHPPLAMGMLAVFYKFFGTSLCVTRVYSMLMTVLTAVLMLQLWRRMGYKWEMGWLPLLLWTLIPAVTLNSHNNMLECTMAVFDLAAVLCMVKRAGHTWSRVRWSLLAGVFVYLAFITKGFTGIYPLAFPLIVWLVEHFFAREHNDKTWNVPLHVALLYTLLPIVSALLCFGLTLLLWPQAGSFFGAYMHKQVLGGIVTPVVSTRFHIVFKFFEQTVIVWVIFFLVMFIRRYIRVNKTAAPGILYTETVVEDLVQSTVKVHLNKRKWQLCLGYALLTCAGVLPIMISLKQRSFYILTVYPFFVLALSAVMNDAVENWLSVAGKRFHLVSAIVSVLMLAGAVAMNVAHYDRPGRDEVMQSDMKRILPELERGEEVAVPPMMGSEYSLLSYYYRDGRVQLYGYQPAFDESADTVAAVAAAGDKALMSDSTALAAVVPPAPADLPKHILTNGIPMGKLAPYYEEIKLNTIQYKLYRRL